MELDPLKVASRRAVSPLHCPLPGCGALVAVEIRGHAPGQERHVCTCTGLDCGFLQSVLVTIDGSAPPRTYTDPKRRTLEETTHAKRAKWAMRTGRCLVTKCARKHFDHGLCQNHYQFWERTGKPEIGKFIKDQGRNWQSPGKGLAAEMAAEEQAAS